MESRFKLHQANADFLDGDYEAAFRSFRVGAAQEDAFAAINLAFMYRQGVLVPQDYELARKLYLSVLGQDEGVAAFNLALLYLRGLGVKPDFRLALRYMEQSAEAGCIDAQLYLGLSYLMGCVYDPVHIECIHYIPCYHVVWRDETAVLYGEGVDPALEDARWEVISPDLSASAAMYAESVRTHDQDEFSQQIGDARFMLGQALIEGVGNTVSPAAGYKNIYQAALYNGHRQAAEFLVENGETAQAYGVPVERVRGLLDGGYCTSDQVKNRAALAAPKRAKPKNGG